MVKISNVAYMKLEALIQQKAILSKEMSHITSQLKDKLVESASESIEKLEKCLADMNECDATMHHLLDNQKNKSIPALQRKPI